MKFFAKNMGQTERIIRIVLGLIAAGLAAANYADMALWLFVLVLVTGLTLVIEGVMAWCPMKAFLGLGTQYDTP
jgi:uncharacterized membrane protein YcaP (DUF421 family)